MKKEIIEKNKKHNNKHLFFFLVLFVLLIIICVVRIFIPNENIGNSNESTKCQKIEYRVDNKNTADYIATGRTIDDVFKDPHYSPDAIAKFNVDTKRSFITDYIMYRNLLNRINENAYDVVHDESKNFSNIIYKDYNLLALFLPRAMSDSIVSYSEQDGSVIIKSCSLPNDNVDDNAYVLYIIPVSKEIMDYSFDDSSRNEINKNLVYIGIKIFVFSMLAISMICFIIAKKNVNNAEKNDLYKSIAAVLIILAIVSAIVELVSYIFTLRII